MRPRLWAGGTCEVSGLGIFGRRVGGTLVAARHPNVVCRMGAISSSAPPRYQRPVRQRAVARSQSLRVAVNLLLAGAATCARFALGGFWEKGPVQVRGELEQCGNGRGSGSP